MEGIDKVYQMMIFLHYQKLTLSFKFKFREIYNLECSINESILTDADFMRKSKNKRFQ